MDDRLAALKDEIDKILSEGPIGRWSNIPAIFPFITETVIFNVDGSGLITSWSALSGKTVQTFAWSMEARARLVMRYRLTRSDDEAEAEGRSETAEEPPELSPVILGIEIVVQETEFGSWPVMVSEGSDAFDCLRTGLARTDPPLPLEPHVEPALQPPRSFFSRMRSLVFRQRMSHHADA